MLAAGERPDLPPSVGPAWRGTFPATQLHAPSRIDAFLPQVKTGTRKRLTHHRYRVNVETRRLHFTSTNTRSRGFPNLYDALIVTPATSDPRVIPNR